MSTKKIEGFVTGVNNGPGYELGNGAGYCDFWEGKKRGFGAATPTNSATLVIHPGKFEPVYTQSEVVAMLREMEDAVECVDVGSYVFCGVPSDKLDAIAAKHGIVLDPA